MAHMIWNGSHPEHRGEVCVENALGHHRIDPMVLKQLGPAGLAAWMQSIGESDVLAFDPVGAVTIAR